MKKVKILFFLAMIGAAVGHYYAPDKTVLKKNLTMAIVGMIVFLLLYYVIQSMNSVDDDIESD